MKVVCIIILNKKTPTYFCQVGVSLIFLLLYSFHFRVLNFECTHKNSFNSPSFSLRTTAPYTDKKENYYTLKKPLLNLFVGLNFHYTLANVILNLSFCVLLVRPNVFYVLFFYILVSDISLLKFMIDFVHLTW